MTDSLIERLIMYAELVHKTVGNGSQKCSSYARGKGDEKAVPKLINWIRNLMRGPIRSFNDYKSTPNWCTTQVGMMAKSAGLNPEV